MFCFGKCFFLKWQKFRVLKAFSFQILKKYLKFKIPKLDFILSFSQKYSSISFSITCFFITISG